MSSTMLWELMDMEAPDKFYVNDKDTPAFLLFPRHHYLGIGKGYSLYMSHVGLIKTFGTRKKALARLKEIVEHANFPMKLYKVKKYGGQKGKRLLFAENHETRVSLDDAKEDSYVKLFEVDEWQPITVKPVEA